MTDSTPIGVSLYEDLPETYTETYCMNCAGSYDDDEGITLSSDSSSGVFILSDRSGQFDCDGCGALIETKN